MVDTSLAARLAQRTDLVPLKGQTDIAGPGATTYTEKGDNDIRLPSRQSLEQQLGVGLSGKGAKSSALPSASPGETVTLSVVARAISAILDVSSGAALKIQGTQALWPDSQPPLAGLLATSLAHTVANSGLFYESHLQQYAAGTRTLAQLEQEPQARFAAYGQAGGSASARESSRDFAGQTVVAEAREANTQDAALKHGPAAAAIHPDAVALVRQQLELLAQPVFRWVGEAWPGTPMDWEIVEEEDQRQAGADGEAAQPTWTTRLAMRLPTLGAVEARLTLAGTTLRVHLAARENATCALLSNGGDELPQRFDALGLQLTALEIGALVTAPAAPATGEDAVAGLGVVKVK